jgi:hypothetical protein
MIHCMTMNVGAAIANALDFIFEGETLSKRICRQERRGKNGERPLTPNGGYRLKFKELPILLANTMKCK